MSIKSEGSNTLLGIRDVAWVEIVPLPLQLFRFLPYNFSARLTMKDALSRILIQPVQLFLGHPKLIEDIRFVF